MARPIPRLYVPQNPQKYVGNVNNIVCRSSWERGLCWFLDHSPTVKYWTSEEIVVPYVSPVDGQVHRYFVDFGVEFVNGQKGMIEVKPEGQTTPPVLPKRSSPKKLAEYAEASRTFAVNFAKWQAAHEYAKQRGMTFEVFTERELRRLQIPI